MNLFEDWYKDINYYGTIFPIFINPSSSDYVELNKNSRHHAVRFIADNKQKKAYVWDCDALHPEVRNIIQLTGNYAGSDILDGVAGLHNGKSILESSDYLDNLSSNSQWKDNRNKLLKILNTNWDWLDKYVLVTPYLQGIKYKLDNPRRFKILK